MTPNPRATISEASQKSGKMRVPAQISAGAKGFSGSDAAKIKTDNAVSDFLDDCGLAHNKVNSGFFRTMMKSVQAAAGTPT